jgi:glycosyltransferase involved in cell wall biosynthesis
LRLLFVNDGSTDDTLSLLQSMAKFLPKQVTALDMPHNCGKAEAVRRGVLAALETSPDCVGFFDADLATPLDELPRMLQVLAHRPDIDVVIGSRMNLLGRRIVRKRKRNLLGRAFGFAASRMLSMPIHDTQCGAKMFRVTERTAALFAEPFISRWIFDVELFARLKVQNCAGLARAAADVVYELPLERWDDVAGSKIGGRDFARAVFELAVIYRRYSAQARIAAATKTEAPQSLPIAGAASIDRSSRPVAETDERRRAA